VLSTDAAGKPKTETAPAAKKPEPEATPVPKKPEPEMTPAPKKPEPETAVPKKPASETAVPKKPETETVTAPGKLDAQTAPAQLPRAAEMAPLPPKVAPGGPRGDDMPWPGEMPAPPKKIDKPSPQSGLPGDQDGSSQDDAKARAAKSYEQVREALQEVSRVSQRQAPRPPQLLMSGAASDPPRFLSPESASQNNQGSAMSLRLVAHEGPASDTPDQPQGNPLR
jgi:hypothetical protein